MLDLAHQHMVYGRRIRVIARHLAELLPRDASILDVGSGDGLLARRVLDVRADLRITGVDVLRRDASHIPVELFDGSRLPYADRQFDVVMMVDVLHHALNQDVLLEETVRVAKRAVVIKDHIVKGPLAQQTLRFMDWMGNARYGVALPYSYWTEEQWRQHFARLHLRTAVMRDHLGLYPWPASLLFERGLHFIAVLERSAA
jgi:ubiquinone/menaquinone biosynthesis C-methylase UbiE